MAKDSSFDVVSVVNMQEVDNAFQQTKKEMRQRYDLKDTASSIELDKNALAITVTAPSDFVVSQIIDILNTKLVKRGIDLKALTWSDPRSGSGGSVIRTAVIANGIDKETASKIAKDVRGMKLKVKASIEGDKLRVSSASKDTLQEVIASLKSNDYGQPLQFINYR